MTPEGSGFNLFKKTGRTSINKKTGKESSIDDNMGWGMRFERCVEIIIKDILAEDAEVLSLRQYIDEYKKLHEDLLSYTT